MLRRRNQIHTRTKCTRRPVHGHERRYRATVRSVHVHEPVSVAVVQRRFPTPEGGHGDLAYQPARPLGRMGRSHRRLRLA